MRKATVDVYRFDELSDEAKAQAKYNHVCIWGFVGADEALDSLKALAKHFGGRLVNYWIDWPGAGAPSHATFEAPDYDDNEEELKRLVEVLGDGSGDCILTGVCYDEDAIDGVREAFQQGERDVEQLLQAGFRTWLESCRKEYEYNYSDEGFSETADGNDWEFTSDGEIYRG